MFRSIDQFEKAWKNHVDSTKKILAALTDESLSQEVAEGYWSLGRTMWHIVTAVPEMMSRTGLKLSSVDPEASCPDKAAAISEAYSSVTDELLASIKSDWSDESLATEDDMYGESWPRGLTLHILIIHEIHHRGQMTVLMRQAGLKVPGVFGPAKEEWTQYGMEAPA